MFRTLIEDIKLDFRSFKSWVKSSPKAIVQLFSPASNSTIVSQNYYKESNFDSLSDVADLPQDFGRKASWFAIKTSNTHAVINNLKLINLHSANWETGFYFGRNSRCNSWVFVAPPIHDWTIVHTNLNFEDDIDEPIEILKVLSKEFGEAQYFVSYRYSSHAAWWLSRKGKVVRGFDYLDGYKINIGETTAAERDVGLPNITKFSIDKLNDLLNDAEFVEWDEHKPVTFLDFINGHFLKRLIDVEDDVFMIAEKWSLNPQMLSKFNDLKPARGYVGLMP